MPGIRLRRPQHRPGALHRRPTAAGAAPAGTATRQEIVPGVPLWPAVVRLPGCAGADRRSASPACSGLSGPGSAGRRTSSGKNVPTSPKAPDTSARLSSRHSLCHLRRTGTKAPALPALIACGHATHARLQRHTLPLQLYYYVSR